MNSLGTTLGVVQMHCTDDLHDNIERAERLVREAAGQGAKVILLPELFESLYFPQLEREEMFALAHDVENHPFLDRFQSLAAELDVVLPVSFFERSGQAYFNSLMMFDAGGKSLGVYRKSHIPDGPTYEEKYYFNYGDTGFATWTTRYGNIGVAICWDQWFPEAARIMALKGADLLLYPTAIGSEPAEAGALDTQAMWRKAMVGHAVSNIVYVGAANRYGPEGEMNFYGSSFISNPKGEMIADAGRNGEVILTAELDYAWARQFRAGWGFFRDRRPDLYKALLTLDGKEQD